jgi:hypothetical protein
LHHDGFDFECHEFAGQLRPSLAVVGSLRASSDFWTYSQGDYEIELGASSFPKEMRAYRKRAKKRGKKCVLRNEALKNETVVLFGPNVSAERAIQLLRKLANQIGKRGIYTGETQSGRTAFERKVIQI